MKKSVPDNFINTTKEPNCTTCEYLAEEKNGYKCALYKGIVFYDSYDLAENFNVAKNYVCSQELK